MLKLPPRFANVPAEVLFGELPDPVKLTLGQIHGLAWQSSGEKTPPMTLAELMAVRGLKKRQMKAHLSLLRAAGRIRVEHLGQGYFVIYPLRWEAGAALPTDEEVSLASGAKNCPELAEKGAENCTPTAAEGPSGAENCPETGERGAKNCTLTPPHGVNHVVIDSINDLNLKQQQHDQGARGPKGRAGA